MSREIKLTTAKQSCDASNIDKLVHLSEPLAEREMKKGRRREKGRDKHRNSSIENEDERRRDRKIEETDRQRDKETKQEQRDPGHRPVAREQEGERQVDLPESDHGDEDRDKETQRTRESPKEKNREIANKKCNASDQDSIFLQDASSSS